MNTFSEDILSRLIILAHFEPIFHDNAWKELEGWETGPWSPVCGCSVHFQVMQKCSLRLLKKF